MKWSKLKQSAESLLADTLKGRIRYQVTKYCRGSSTSASRGWITFDGKELENFPNEGYVYSSRYLMQRTNPTINEWQGTPAHSDLEHSDKFAQAEKLLDKDYLGAKDEFYLALQTYILIPIDAALNSSNAIVRAIALFDRRCGKRRLGTLKPSPDAPSLVKECFGIRCEAEGLSLSA
ncbi:MAG TPA: hypothetical protein VF784_10625 [Anaerolineales bacterium]